MQLKIYKKSLLFLSLVIIIDAICIVAIIYNITYLKNNSSIYSILFVIGISVLTLGYAYYDLNAAKIIVKKRVTNGDVAMAKILSGKFVKFARDARLRNHVYWELDVEIYDNNMNKINATIIEKFSTHQTKIPSGFVYVTYIEGKENDSLIIPNIIISSIPEYGPLVNDYENYVKPIYLNVYYNDGLIIQSYKEAIKTK